MAIVREQAAGAGHYGAGGHAAFTATFPNAVKSGSLLVCWFEGNCNTGTFTVSDSVNGAWTVVGMFTDIPSSGKSYGWAYKENSGSSTAGGCVVTVTPNANTGNTEACQIVEYSGIATSSSLDSATTARSTQASGTPANITSGTPSVTGELILMGFASDTESNKTFSATSGITGIVLGTSDSKTGGQANGSATMAIGEKIGATTSPLACSMGLGNGDDAGRYVIGFKAATGSVITKTQTAVARIANTRTKTQSSVARIANNKTKTQSAIARIANLKTKTQSAIARISNTRTKTQSATANIYQSVVSTKTQTAIARIAKTVTTTQTAIARISNNLTKTQSAKARISNTATKQQTAVARIAKNSTKTQSAIARIAKNTTKTQSAIARISTSQTKNQTAKARISNNLTKTQTATAYIVQNVYKFNSPVLSGPMKLLSPWERRRRNEIVDNHFNPQATGVTILKVGGQFKEVTYPTSLEIQAAEAAYIGGHENVLTQQEANDLIAAGYDVEVTTNGG